jgi:DNA-binding GntR family transcriptional regulator
LTDHSERYRLAFGGYAEWEDRRHLHRQILDAAEAGDAELAARRLAEHYANTASLVLGVLDPEHDWTRLSIVMRTVAPGAEMALGHS